MQSLTVSVPNDPASCWRVFTDAARLPAWVPGLRQATILVKERGLPAEVHFELDGGLAYTLVYTYDLPARHVRWEPKLGRAHGVSGFVRFEPDGGGTRVTYGLAHGTGRGDAARAADDLARLVDAFVARMGAER